MQFIDIIIFVVIAILLLLKLKSVLNKHSPKASSNDGDPSAQRHQDKSSDQKQHTSNNQRKKAGGSFGRDWKKNREEKKRRQQGSQQKQEKEHSSKPGKIQEDLAFFGLKQNYSLRELTAARNNKLKENHPDKVSHMGEEIKNLAKAQTQKINDTFERLRTRL